MKIIFCKYTLFVKCLHVYYSLRLKYIFFSGGGTGFVGKHLKEYLKNNNYDVTIISRKTNKLNESCSAISWVRDNYN